ncbi:diacylglycerol/lipid kinase family protein [Maribacter hydrothermalis]|uniref:Diacylglycerol kinase n=1 Tax=Maribacter hydrothermalis TaxID=1836467 RepID=A0A1B7Z4A2_9FLAO|nr:diacylglycerol kinase family protein [Maribacter hydrothermalis]APQ17276.1 diacylglycerol kinase [Maribacter hydrothermalis]OBR37535.1 diacylglycerol kinase [Maribacter hydrothermalis]
MIRIHFIVNPIAGHGNAPLTQEELQPFFINGVHDLTIKVSEYKAHATELTKASIQEKADIIVACGGDGTINEVATCLIGTDIALGIVPMGSGNGLASNLKIPKKRRKALEIIRNKHVERMDVGNINGRYFFSNTGVGFDASLIKHYESSEKRTILGYISACAITFRDIEKNEPLSITVDEETPMINPFIILISNSNEMGYKLSLTPKASLQDGLLDVLVIKKIGKFKMLWLGFLILIRKVHWLKESKSFQTKNIQLKCDDSEFFDTQVDGEHNRIDNNHLNISLLEKSLCVLTAK